MFSVGLVEKSVCVQLEFDTEVTLCLVGTWLGLWIAVRLKLSGVLSCVQFEFS